MSLELFEFATSLVAANFHIIPLWGCQNGVCQCPLGSACKTPGKHPLASLVPHGVKNATQNKSVLAKWFGTESPNKDHNIGIGTGFGNLFVVDLDLKSNGLESWQGLVSTGNHNVPVTLTARTGGGGRHLYFYGPTGLHIANSAGQLGPGIDIRGSGGYVVAPPSTHQSGEQYEFLEPNASIAEAPQWLLELLAAGNLSKFSAPKEQKEVPPELIALVKSTGWKFRHKERLLELIDACPACLSSPMAAVGAAPKTAFINSSGFLRCLRGKCPTNQMEQKGVFGWAQDTWISRLTDSNSKRLLESQSVAVHANSANWETSLITDNKGNIEPQLSNVALILEHTTTLAYNEFSDELTCLEPLPWQNAALPGKAISDLDYVNCGIWLQTKHSLKVSKDTIADACLSAGHIRKFHPIREQLLGYHWDGTKRLDTWLSDYTGAEDTPYTRSVAANWALSTVARILKPGCQVDSMMILESAQGLGKSTLLQAWAGSSEFFYDGYLDLKSKDSCLAMQRCWIVEMPELSSLKSNDLERLKGFLTSRSDNYRAPYERTNRDHPRHCVFAGSTNKEEYLTDDTGNRRFLPIQCGSAPFRIEDFKRNRNQLLAEAVVRYQTGESWWDADWSMSETYQAEQAARVAEHPWSPTIREWIGSHVVPIEGWILSNILTNCLSIPIEQHPTASKDAGRALKEAGLIKKRIVKQGQRTTRWYPVGSEPKEGIGFRLLSWNLAQKGNN